MEQSRKVKEANLPKTKFDMSYEHKTTLDMGWLVPVFTKEVIPGDNIKIKPEMIMKMVPLLAPLMHRVNVYLRFYEVPYRLLDKGFTKMISQKDPNHVIPHINAVHEDLYYDLENVTSAGNVLDYVGFPVNNVQENSEQLPLINAYRLLAYRRIWSDHYRHPDLDLEDSFEDELEAGKFVGAIIRNEIRELLELKKARWESDYFTSCLPTALRGSQIGAQASANGAMKLINVDDTTISGNQNMAIANDGTQYGVNDQHSLKLVSGIQTLVQEIRRAEALQRFMELSLRVGSRYVQFIKGVFGAQVPDYTAQMAVLIGGGKMPVSIGDVVQTSESGTSPQGNLAGRAISAGTFENVDHNVNEFGLIMGLLCVVPRSSYCDGIPREMLKTNVFDYYFPQFANVGEQEVKQAELNLNVDEDVNKSLFGYQERYGEYKTSLDMFSGKMRTNMAHYHLGRKFPQNASTPLTAYFMYCSPDKRIFPSALQSGDVCIVTLYFDVEMWRSIPRWNDPI